MTKYYKKNISWYYGEEGDMLEYYMIKDDLFYKWYPSGWGYYGTKKAWKGMFSGGHMIEISEEDLFLELL